MAGQDTEHPFYVFYYLGPVDCPLAEMTRDACKMEARSPKPFRPPFSQNIYSSDTGRDVAENPGWGIGDLALAPVGRAPAAA